MRRPIRRFFTTVLTVQALTLSCLVATPGAAYADVQPWDDTSLSPDERAGLLLEAMTFNQKMVLFAPTPTPVPELRIPPRREIDGCCGVVVTDQPTTGLPAGLSLASTFSPDLAASYGDVIGGEAWDLGYAGVGSPTMDLSRSPWNGRQNESFGEDPLVAGRIGSGQIRGIQTNSVYSLTKHYVLNDQESRRNTVNEVVDERTLNEFWTRPWEIAVQTAAPGAVMCAFPRINGEYACGNRETLTNILKGRLGFPGFVSSDFDALHSFQDYVNGADVGSPSQFMGDSLRQAVEAGVVPMDRFNNMVFRILRTFFATGVYDNPAPGLLQFPYPPSSPVPTATLDNNEAIARQIASDGAVLLSNSNRGLPLSPDTSSIAVIGSDADWYIAGSNGFTPRPARLTTILDGITARAGSGVSVEYVPGTDPVRLGDTMRGLEPVPSAVLSPVAGAGPGMLAEYFQNPAFAGAPFVARVEDQVNVRNGLSSLIQINSTQVPGVPIPVALNPASSWRYTGTLTPPVSGSYELGLSLLGSAQLFVDGNAVLDADFDSFATSTVTLQMEAGRAYGIRIDYRPDAPNQFSGSLGDAPLGMLRFGWTPPSTAAFPEIQQAVTAAEQADVAVVVARDYSGEMADRGTLTLPQAQDRLIREVARANPRTVVVLATGGPVLMPWLNDVAAVLEMWYPGEAQGKAAADLLFGDVAPSGKLPITFPASEQQPLQIGVTNSFDQLNAANPTAQHPEGVFVGYRGYEENRVRPLFPFGHGLTYSRFSYGRVAITDPQVASAAGTGATGEIRVRVKNTGRTSATDTVQVYSGELPTNEVATPPKQLIGWAEVTLGAGEQRTVSIPVDVNGPERPLSYFDATADSWVTPQGRVRIYVGGSSADARSAGWMQVR